MSILEAKVEIICLSYCYFDFKHKVYKFTVTNYYYFFISVTINDLNPIESFFSECWPIKVLKYLLYTSSKWNLEDLIFW